MNRFVLGTAQLSGMPYDRSRDGLTDQESFAILDAAWEAGIRAFDTAEAYGQAAHRLERWLVARGRQDVTITTKVTLGQGLDHRAHGARLRFCDWDTTLLVHGLPDQWDWQSARRWVSGQKGCSLYLPHEVRMAAKLPGLDRLQVPGNIRNLECLVARPDGIPLDVRSVFGNGTLLKEYAPVDLIRFMLQQLKSGDRLVVGISEPSQIGSLVAAAGMVPQ